MAKLRTLFAGTPDFAVPSLDALRARADVELVAVYTQPDRPAGRGRRLRPGPVKQRAVAAGVPVLQPPSFTQPEAIEEFAAHRADLLVVAAYGLILPTAVLEAAGHCINVHASLLPRWRGAAPIQRAIMAGDTTTGISIMRVVERLDAGPVWLELECPIDADDTGGSLHDKLAALGGRALDAALDLLAAGRVEETPQDEAAVTYAEKITAADRALDVTRPALELERTVRALAPRPGARLTLAATEARVLAASVRQRDGAEAPGTVIATDDGPLVVTGDGALLLTQLQPAGKQAMSGAAFINGYGDRL